ncbi:MAG: hypothetical protein P9L92_04705 [Candidatus Electryonea clarkiae]|nr:hypothetical protein [Candidatus Electryonea clarkiae]MDP8288465.1 hypothetical protein [Candidatus Electryonea clarkiae]
MSDPLAKLLDDEDKIYGKTPTISLLLRMYEVSTPEVFLEEIEKLLERVVLLEMFLEEEHDFHISKEKLEDFRSRRYTDLQVEMGRMASIVYGAISSRESG